MFRTLALFCAFIVANSIVLPLIWHAFIYEHSQSLSPNIDDTKKYIDINDLKSLLLLLNPSRQTSELEDTQTHYTLTIDNFHTQSRFKLLPVSPYREVSRDTFDKWLSEQVEISFNKILSNIGDDNWSSDLVNYDNVALGAVIASPSKADPDYFYQWTRDGAITINTVINYLVNNQFKNTSIVTTVENYIDNSENLQKTSNPSGDYNDGTLLNFGEPKFNVDGTPFTGNWGRPQNDGPPLRVISIDNFLKNLKKFSVSSNESYIYYNIIKPDLEFICRYWKANNFDLWEEVNSQHFFTSLVQLKALKIGIKLHKQLDSNDELFGERLETTFEELSKFILVESGYIDNSLTHIVETPSILGSRSGLDTAIIIGVLLTHNDDEDKIPFDVTDGLVLNTLSALIKSMKLLYPINHSRVNLNLGVGLGRYPEDIYNGNGVSEGNPWFLCTLAGAEMMYKLISDLYLSQQDLLIDSSNQLFYFNHVIEKPTMFSKESSSSSLRIPYNTLAFNQTMASLFQFGDSFLDIVREHVADDGSMSEQFDKYTGYMRGATDLTWSYGSLWSANRWRQRALDYVS
ncbi:CYFA0S07e04170g1_1 [Cyberlindnera fabianii]|uniref:glucan 1,4-alpha-glucosidase n=1 Tax=Cyberlindnera fabianii TaxID=36022 RepID=A0A061B3M7_CYBFA|nr:CYFA0S07e04170g1_1 [Cyberlindnera fabianii]